MAYGLRIINDVSDLLIDSNYVNPTFVQKLEFSTTESAAPSYGDLYLHPQYIRRYYSTPTVSIGTGSYIVLWALPESLVSGQATKDVWYMFPTSVAENNLQFDCSVFSRSDSSATYTLPTAYVFTVDADGLETMSSTGPALRMYNQYPVLISTTGTVGSITGSGPWTGTITGMSSTTGLVVGSTITATNGSGSLGSAGIYTVSGSITGSSVSFTATTGTTPIAGVITNVIGNIQKKTFDSNFTQLAPYEITPLFSLPIATNAETSSAISTPTNPIYLLPKTAIALANQSYSTAIDIAFRRKGQFVDSKAIPTAVEFEGPFPSTATYFYAGTFSNLSVIVADANLYQTSSAGTGGGSSPTYVLSSNVTSVNEGGSFTITLTTTNIPNGTLVPYNVTGIQDLDLTAGVTTSNFTINNNTASVTFTVKNDTITENTETFRLEVTTGSFPFIDITILDTSTAAVTAYTITPAANSLDEDYTGLLISVSGTNITDGTYYWKINHVTTAAADFFANSGSFSIASNSGSFSIVAYPDNKTEGAETFTVSILSGSTSGTLLKTSGSITVNDTSLWPVAGTLLSASCLAYGASPYTIRSVFADGSGGTTSSDANNSTSCGYIAPGTLQSSSCLSYGVAPYTLRNTYYNGPDATFGTYIVDTNNSATCGWTQTYNEIITASPSIVSLSNSIDLEIFYGKPNEAAYIVSTNNGDPQPTLATFTNSTPFYLDTSGYYINTVLGSAISATPADKRLWVYFPYSGNYRNARVQVVLDAGTVVGGEYCGTGSNSTKRYQDYANGTGGVTTTLVDAYSVTCGWVAPTASWTVQYSNSGTSGDINVTVNVSLTGPTPTAQTFSFSGYVSENSAAFNLPAVTVNAHSSSGQAVGASGFVNGTTDYATITLVASVETAPYTISPSTISNAFLFSNTGGGGGGY